MPFIVGETIGPYRLVEQLGQGGMATVFKAYHASLDRYVAIKALHPAFMEDPNFLARFQREARVVAKLDHPNIVPVYDFAEHEGRPYLVMKFIEGETLKARLHRQPLMPGQVLEVAEAVGAALAYAHRQGILHRDVKPSNVILANDGQVYLADFGLARIAAAGESTLSSDTVLGTPQYISPEQALGKRELDAGTDIYSLGVVFYEMVVGKVPFSGDTPFAVIHDHIYTPLPPPRQHNPAISEAVERVLLKALAKERPDRYTDVTAMIAAFRQAMAGTPSLAAETQALPPSPSAAPYEEGTPAEVPASGVQTVSLHPPARRRKVWLWACSGLLLLALCACVAVGAFNFYRGRMAGRATQAARPTQRMEAAAPPREDTPLAESAVLPEAPVWLVEFDGELPGWELQPGWEHNPGAGTLCAGERTAAIYRGDIFGDASMILSFRGEGVFRWSVRMHEPPLRRYLVTFDLPGREASLAKQLSERVINENLVSGAFEYKPDDWNTALLFMKGDVIELSVNGQPVWSYRDARPLEAGWIAFENMENSLCFDRLFVEPQQPPPE
ncbi:MAG: protein kinase domain-containing protein [Chloroflexota bacterium]